VDNVLCCSRGVFRSSQVATCESNGRMYDGGNGLGCRKRASRNSQVASRESNGRMYDGGNGFGCRKRASRNSQVASQMAIILHNGVRCPFKHYIVLATGFAHAVVIGAEII